MKVLTYQQKLAQKIASDQRARTKFLAKPRPTPKRSRIASKTPKKRKKPSDTSASKTRIQSLIRSRVIERDGGCILRHYHEAGACGGFKNDGELILQGEHLNGRANSVSYGELDNIVCLCMHHHIFFKRQNPARYWVLVQKHLDPKRWERVQAWILDRSAHRFTLSDWKRIEELLKSPSV